MIDREVASPLLAQPEQRITLRTVSPEIQEYWQQRQLVDSIFQEVYRSDQEIRNLQGPYYPENTEILKAVEECLPYISPGLRPEHLSPYRFGAECEFVHNLSVQQKNEIHGLKRRRIDSFESLGLQRATVDTGTIETGLLDVPNYIKQDYRAVRACFRTCFRMILNEITGFQFREDVMRDTMDNLYEQNVIHDSEYMKFLGTESFSESFPDLDNHVVTITGANFDVIAKIAKGIKQRNQDISVYSIVSLQTETVETAKDIWHANVLLEVTDDEVITHDPASSIGIGMPFRSQSRQDFHKRWAIGLNRAHLIMSQPAS